ncbi:MAG: ADP-ribosyltransferase [Clostridia bacterium]
MYISIPKGTHGAYIADISHAENEKELLLQAGQRFVVRDAKLTFGIYDKDVPTLPTFWLKDNANLHGY